MISITLPLTIIMFIYNDSIRDEETLHKNQAMYMAHLNNGIYNHRELKPLYNEIMEDAIITDDEYFEFIAEEKFLKLD